MLDILNLAVPFFGLMALGFLCGRFQTLGEDGLAWMDFFIIYVALPAFFFRIIAQTPFAQLANPRFIAAIVLATTVTLLISLALALFIRRNLAEAGIAALAGAYGNVGYMGPGLAVSMLGAQASAPVALIFCFDSMVIFCFAPVLMAIAGAEVKARSRMVLDVGARIALHPFIIATALGAMVAALGLTLPVAIDRMLLLLQNAAAPCALFTLGVTVALRRVDRIAPEIPVMIGAKLVLHPLLVLASLALLGPFEASWVATAFLMAALPPALNVFVLARQYGRWVPEASTVVLLGTAVSAVTLSVVMWAVRTGQIPSLGLP